MNKFPQKLATTALYTGTTVLARLIKMSFLIGSKISFFSVAHCVNPLIGLYATGSTMLMALGAAALVTATNVFGPLLLVCHIPTWCGALYLNRCVRKPASKVSTAAFALLFALCALLFIVHPVGSQAKAYTLLWLIPFAGLFMAQKNSFFQAYITTMVTHAVGSVMWLYAVGPVTGEAWLALIPVAFAERLIFASGMTLCIEGLAAARIIGPRFLPNLFPHSTTQQ